MAIEKAWDESVEIGGIEKDYESAIDRDQAVDEDGNACYSKYYFLIPVGDDEDENYERYEYTAEEMEAFALTW